MFWEPCGNETLRAGLQTGFKEYKIYLVLASKGIQDLSCTSAAQDKSCTPAL